MDYAVLRRSISENDNNEYQYESVEIAMPLKKYDIGYHYRFEYYPKSINKNIEIASDIPMPLIKYNIGYIDYKNLESFNIKKRTKNTYIHKSGYITNTCFVYIYANITLTAKCIYDDLLLNIDYYEYIEFISDAESYLDIVHSSDLINKRICVYNMPDEENFVYIANLLASVFGYKIKPKNKNNRYIIESCVIPNNRQ